MVITTSEGFIGERREEEFKWLLTVGLRLWEALSDHASN